MKKIILLIIGIAVLAGAFALSDRLPQQPAEENESEESLDPLSQYFRDRMIALGVEDIGMPIEGFDAQLLIMAYPALEPSDFEGVQAFEGRYSVVGGEIAYTRDTDQPVTSAERTIADEGYVTLLANVSNRLGMGVRTETDIDALVARINTSERLTARIEESAGTLGVTVIPHEILEDSRCPIDVQCIQAGTVRLRATLVSGLGTSTPTFVLNEPITTEGEEITLVQVAPDAESTVELAPSDYIFTFSVSAR